jgi:protein-L-isoaspartate(D-aspartate) O-methyltransferase
VNGEHDFRVARARMVNEQLRGAGLAEPRVLAAMRDVPRHLFVPRLIRHRAYQACALPIGYGQTISQPFTVGLMTALLELTGAETVLEVGTGSGYQAAILSRLAGTIVSVERIEPLARRAESVLRTLDCANVAVHTVDGCEPPEALGTFDGIVVTACADSFPDVLYRRLREGGRLVIPLLGQDGGQTLYRFQRRTGRPAIERSVPCRFVPLLRGLAMALPER